MTGERKLFKLKCKERGEQEQMSCLSSSKTYGEEKMIEIAVEMQIGEKKIKTFYVKKFM